MNISILAKKVVCVLLVAANVFITTSYLNGQECSESTVQLTLPDKIVAEPGDQFCVEVNVNNFEDIVLFFFVINFNSTVLQFDSANPLISGLTGFTAGDITPPREQDPDVIRILWSHPNLSASSLPDNSPLLELCFTVIGTPGNNGQILFNNTGLGSPSEFLNDVNASFTPCNPNPNSGFIEVVPAPSADPQLFVTGQCGSVGGNSEGITEIKAFYGTPPYTILSDQGNIVGTADQSTFLFTGLSLGPHSYTAVDATGLQSSPLNITITNDPAFVIEPITIKLPNCPLEGDGRISLEVDGGKPFANGEYFFDWGTAQIGLGQSELKDLDNGTYNVTVIDSLGCKQTESYELLRTPIEIEEINITDAQCEGRNNGIISVSASGGGPYIDGYIWNLDLVENDIPTPISPSVGPRFQTEFRILAPGTYIVTAMDSVDRRKNCAVQKEVVIGFGKQLEASLDESSIQGVCAADEIETIINISSIGDEIVFPVSIQIIDTLNNIVYDDAIPNLTQINVGCLKYGDHSVLLEDSEGCSSRNTITILGNTIMLLDSTIISPKCHSDSAGFISLNVTSDNLPLSFEWSNDISGEGIDSIGNLISGIYSVTVSDPTGAIRTYSFELNEPEEFLIDLSADEILCPEGTTNIFAAASGGSGTIEYSWSPITPMENNSVLANVPAGSYTLMASDENGCTFVDSITIDGKVQPQSSLSNINSPQCADDNSATAVLSVMTSTDYPGPFFFESSTGLRGSGVDFGVTNFSAGTGNENWIFYSDGVCQFDTVYVDIEETLPYSINFDESYISEIQCFDDNIMPDDSIKLVANGPEEIVFTWPDINRTGPSQSGLSAGTYQVILSVGNCQVVDSIVITEPNLLELSIDSTQSVFALCGGDNSTMLSLSAIGGIPEYNFSWTDENDVEVSNNALATDLAPGTYNASVTDSNDCLSEITVDVFEPEPVVALIGNVIDPLCSSDQGYITIDTAYGGVAGSYRYQVNTAPAISVNDTAIVIPGNITVRVFDQNGCSWDSMVTILEPQFLSVALGPDETIELGQSVDIRAAINSQASIDTIIWTPRETLDCLFDNCSEVRVNPVANTNYEVIVQDINGCTVTDDISINIQRSSNIYIPNAFAPSATIPGNATFKVFAGSGVSNIDFIRVYDRWGNLVHRDEGPFPVQLSGVGTWNGYLNNDTGKELETGVYVYVVQFSFLDGGVPELRKGNVTLIR